MMRPKIICQMTTTVDGRMLAERWSKPAQGIDEKQIRGYYDEIYYNSNTDGWIVGRQTMEEFLDCPPRNFEADKAGLRETFIGERKGRKVAVVIDQKGKLHYGSDNVGGDHVITILGSNVPDEYLAELRHDGISYFFADIESQVTPDSRAKALRSAMEDLSDMFSIQTLFLQGGAITNGNFLKAGLIDEFDLLIYPGIDGLKGIPTSFEYQGEADELPAKGQALRHVATETLEGGVVWIRYITEQISQNQ